MRIQLIPERIIETVARLETRIRERFPESSLGELAGEIHDISREAADRSRKFVKPYLPLRLASGFILLMIVVVCILAVLSLRVSFRSPNGWELLTTVEAVFSSTVFLGAALFFVGTLESRFKRKRALTAIEELRVIAHVIDMHQLTKDPDRVLGRGPRTPSSPKPELTPFELWRYLDYSSELLALLGKIAVLYGQGIHDTVVLDSVDDMEDLTTGLAGKLWQKIMILDQETGRLPK